MDVYYRLPTYPYCRTSKHGNGVVDFGAWNGTGVPVAGVIVPCFVHHWNMEMLSSIGLL